MPKLFEIDEKKYVNLLSGNAPHSFAENAAPGTVPANPNRRTLLIGLGGIGARTVDKIKGEMQKRFLPGWDQMVSFLAVDSDYGDMQELHHLTGQETVCTTRPGIDQTVRMGPMHWPLAWQSFVQAEELGQMPGFDHPGAGGRRQAGRMKLYYKPMGSLANDEEVVERLRHMIQHRMEPLWNAPHYDVYVISSLCGGTGSGMLMDFPALIRQALAGYRVNIHAICYLPETVTALMNPRQRVPFESNAYAALKELDHYMNALSQPGHTEEFPSNDPAGPRRLDSAQGFYQQVILVGAPKGVHPGAAAARENVCQFLLNLNTGYEAEDPLLAFLLPAPVPVPLEIMTPEGFRRNYSAMGTARAELPRDILRAWQAGKLCEKAGLQPVSAEERAAMVAAGQIPPFLDRDAYESAARIRQDAMALLQPLEQFLHRTFGEPLFSYEQVFGHVPTWEEIRNGEADNTAIHRCTEEKIRQITGSEMEHRLREQVTELFHQFRSVVMQYVEDKGPYAFANLFAGLGLLGADDRRPMGIREILGRLQDGIWPDTGRPMVWPVPDHAYQEFQQIHRQIQQEPNHLLHHMLFRDRRQDDAYRWVRAYDAFANARVFEICRKMLLGSHGILAQCFLEPACRLEKELYAFGRVLEDLTDIYRNHGAALEDYEAFRDLGREGKVVNIGGLLPEIHNGIRQEMAQQLALVNPMSLRQALVQSFFADPERWMAVDARDIEGGAGTVRLYNPEQPVFARKRFDEILDQHMPPVPDFPMRELAQMAMYQGISGAKLAKDILDHLIHRCLNGLGSCVPEELHWELSYPRDVQMNDPALASALQHEVTLRFPVAAIRVSQEDCTVSLRCLSKPFAAFHLPEVCDWKESYVMRLNAPGNGLHSPGRAYPGIVPPHM